MRTSRIEGRTERQNNMETRENYGSYARKSIRQTKEVEDTEEDDNGFESDTDESYWNRELGSAPYSPRQPTQAHSLRQTKHAEPSHFAYKFGIVAVVLVMVYIATSMGSTPEAKVSKEDSLRNQIYKNIKSKFPSQKDELWFSLLAGIKRIVDENPTSPSIFLLLHSADESKTSACLALKVGEAATEFLNDGKESPVIIEGRELKKNQSLMEDYGIFTEEFRSIVEQRKVMVVKDLHEIPAEIAQTFHTFCDVVTPLVHKAAYFFSLNAGSMEGKPTEVAETILTELWKGGLKKDIRDPLITRITNSVSFIGHETVIPCTI